MDSIWIDKWNDRYSTDKLAYGEQPNHYLKEQLEKVPTGSILFPAEGEGGSAVYAATLGWIVSAFDISAAGQKALKPADANQVTINYRVGELASLHFW